MYFAGRLAADRMPLAGLVLNRVVSVTAELAADEARAAAERLDELGGHQATAEVLRVHAELADQRDRQAAVSGRFLRAHPGVPVVKIPAQPADVHDLDGRRAIGSSF
jgi:hypothetical protein